VKVYRFDAVLDGRPIRIAGLGGGIHLAGEPPPRARARELIRGACSSAKTANGADAALAVSPKSARTTTRAWEFEIIATQERRLARPPSRRVTGAPMTMVRGGGRSGSEGHRPR